TLTVELRQVLGRMLQKVADNSLGEPDFDRSQLYRLGELRVGQLWDDLLRLAEKAVRFGDDLAPWAILLRREVALVLRLEVLRRPRWLRAIPYPDQPPQR